MKTLKILISILLILSVSNCQMSTNDSNSKENDKSIYLSLYFHKTDELKNKSEGEIFVFGKYLDGKYTPVTDYNELTGESIKERLVILKRHPEFEVYFHGQPIKRLKIRKIDSSEYDCSNITVGKCEGKIADTYLRRRKNEFAQGRVGWSNEKDVRYSLTNFISLSTNIPKSKKPIAKSKPIDSVQYSLIFNDLRNKFSHHNNSLTNFIVDIKKIAPICYDNDSKPFFVTTSTCSDSTNKIFISLVCIYKLKNGNIIETKFEKYEEVSFDSWGDGYEYIDAVDVDSDNNPELFFQIDGYESSDIVIYKYQNGRFVVVLETGLYGC